MKRILLIFILSISLMLCACSQNVNMEILIAYQKTDFRSKARIECGTKNYSVIFEKQGESLKVNITEVPSLEKFTFIFGEDGNFISTDSTNIPLEKPELLEFYKLCTLFSAPISDAWKIKHSSPGGVDVYICENSNYILYIDTNSHLPLKIVYGDITADIIYFQPVSR